MLPTIASLWSLAFLKMKGMFLESFWNHQGPSAAVMDKKPAWS